ncbi:MAG: thymidine phosphorylase [Myxococcota bacterium]|nr:thymidine phosphorylase [Myxococcota bacterium]
MQQLGGGGHGRHSHWKLLTMDVRSLIQHKRDGASLSEAQINSIIGAYVDGTMADYQMSALAMAIFYQGLDDEELQAWTTAMVNSGVRLKMASVPGSKVDKHSTGGVGDKMSIPLAPLVAACGAQVPMISGRGLGLTGGTLDKLESIPGFQTRLNESDFERAVAENGCAIVGQTDDLVPADRKLYALRDVTGTVACDPLIVSSILSKKVAEGIDSLVLDVKCGSGAFMQDINSARRLAARLVKTAKGQGLRCGALITDMNQPIGRMVGNALEIRESIALLKGEGPRDSWNLILELGSRMLVYAKEARNIDDGKELLESAQRRGRALARFEEMIEIQGGNPAILENPDLLPTASSQVEVTSPREGLLASWSATNIARAAAVLGAGRQKVDDQIDPAVGIELIAEPGQRVSTGDVLAILHVNDKGIQEAQDLVAKAAHFDGSVQLRKDRVLDWIE